MDGSEAASRRRRGAALETAILDAAWVELSDHGYSGLTFEAVARRAETSRTVLHRRWGGRAELVAAAIAQHVQQNPLTVPDLGSLRDELLCLLRRFSDRSPPRLVRLVFEMSEDLEKAQSSFLAMGGKGVPYSPVRAILDRAVVRGELDGGEVSRRLMSLPTDLARHEIMMTLEPLSDEAIREIVDDVLLPLIAPRR